MLSRNVCEGSPASAGLVQLELNGVEIHSLAELRQNFNLDQVAAAVADGTLIQWLKDR